MAKSLPKFRVLSVEDIELALDAAHKAKEQWNRVIADHPLQYSVKNCQTVWNANLELLAVAETWDNGKPIRETLAADIPLAIDHFRYFAGCIRAQEGGISEIDEDTIAYHFHEPFRCSRTNHSVEFPILMAAWKLAPALAAGNCIVLKPAEQTPVSILVLAELIQDILPPGVLNHRQWLSGRSRPSHWRPIHALPRLPLPVQPQWVS